MSIDRKPFKLPFRKNGLPQWPCPACGKLTLRINSDSFKFEESRHSKRHHHDPNWDPDWIRYVFSCLLSCANAGCEEKVSCIGTGAVDYDVNFDIEGEPEQSYEEFFSPTFFQPHLPIFQCPKNTPKPVRNALDSSFSLFFSSPASAANQVRIAMEHLLTTLKVKRFVRV